MTYILKYAKQSIPQLYSCPFLVLSIQLLEQEYQVEHETILLLDHLDSRGMWAGCTSWSLVLRRKRRD